MTECRFCHCTETSACVTEDGPCYWYRPEYCSACAEKHLEQLVDAAYQWGSHCAFGDHHISVCDRAWRITASERGLVVFDHLGVPTFAFDAENQFLAPHYDPSELLPLFQRAE